MKTQNQEAGLIGYWANQYEDTADEILASLEFYDDNSQDALTEHVGYLIDDVHFLREYARNLRINPR